jgi:branched-chain amino acid transport system substrate-binding protein
MFRAGRAASIATAVAIVGGLGVIGAGCGGDDGGSATTSASKAGSKEPIKFGVQVPLTGIYAAVGTPMSNGIKMAVDEVNKAGGINGRPLEPVILDDTSDKPAQAAANAARLAQEGVPASIHSVGGNTIAAMPSDARAGMLSFLTTSWDVITESGGKHTPQTFYIQIDAKTTVGPLMACYAGKGYNAKTAAWISGNNDPSGAAFLAGAEKFLAAYGVKLVKKVGITQPTTDATSQVRSLLDAKPDVIINSVSGAGGVVVQKNLEALKSKTPVIGGVVWAQSGALKDIGAAANGVVMPNNLNGDFPQPHQEAFTTAYKAKYNLTADTFAAAGYDSVKLIAAALKKYPDATAKDGKKLAEYLETQQIPGVMAKSLQFGKFDQANAQTHSALKKEDLAFFKIDGGAKGTAPTVTPVENAPTC